MIIIRATRYNKNTVSALLGSLETAGARIYDDVLVISSLSTEELGKIPLGKHVFLFSFTTLHREHAYEDVKTLEKLFPGSSFIAGGPHASGDPEDTLSGGFDIAIRGEGEKWITSHIGGLKSLGLSQGIYGPEPETCSLDAFPPFPLKEPRYGLYIEITRGCPYACSFCQTSKIFGIKPRHRSVENILKYSETMITNGLTDLRFVSPNSLSYGSKDGKGINMPAIEELLSSLSKLVKGKGRVFFGSFPSEVRPEFVNDATMALMRKYCDNDNIIIGGQSGSDKVLKLTNRRHKSADIETAADTALRHGFKVNVDFLFGFDFEGKDEALQSAGLMARLVKKGVKIHAHRLIPVSGTKYYGQKDTAIRPEIMAFLRKHHGKGMVYGNF
ncbi:MAG TPA: TIGR04013 family B12-binding domain/radical SAM domain-containing protein [Candidatus Goldiibacteriota bacterium]|nr:TIGR04013 family B12-binding domain/radical SAM domain-containing protein [Candidatus Goldiibacteriota bacterium]